jgi:hypothetical protein
MSDRRANWEIIPKWLPSPDFMTKLGSTLVGLRSKTSLETGCQKNSCEHAAGLRTAALVAGKPVGRNNTPLKMLNMAVFAPIARAKVRIATTANAGLRSRLRNAYRRSCMAVPRVSRRMSGANVRRLQWEIAVAD